MKINKFLTILFFWLSALFFVSDAFAAFKDCGGDRNICNDGQYQYCDRTSGEWKCQEDQVGEEGKDRGCDDLNTRLAEARECLFCCISDISDNEWYVGYGTPGL